MNYFKTSTRKQNKKILIWTKVNKHTWKTLNIIKNNREKIKHYKQITENFIWKDGFITKYKLSKFTKEQAEKPTQ